ncbi:hypothetical protein D3C80_1737940 [compost metagenome]
MAATAAKAARVVKAVKAVKVAKVAKAEEKEVADLTVETIKEDLMTTVRVDTIGIIVAVKADAAEVSKLLNSSVRRLITRLRKLSFVAQ